MNPVPPRQPLLEVRHLTVQFQLEHRLFARGRKFNAVHEVSFALEQGETLGLVGESGSGKTTLGRAIVRLLPAASGKILFDGEDLAQLKGRALRARRRKLQIIFQDPYSSLDPRFTVEDTVAEGLDIHGLARDKAARLLRVAELLTAVGLDPALASRYPHEFSGGQRQRIGLARALALDPRLLVCDEPVSSLDVSIQAQIINLLQDLQQTRGIACLFIAHDLAVIEHISRRVMVMYLGRIVELGPAKAVVRAPLHPYTQALVSAVPVPDPASKRARIVLPGEPPSPFDPPSGCPFHPRCPRAQFPRCAAETPLLREVVPGHFAACHFSAVDESNASAKRA